MKLAAVQYRPPKGEPERARPELRALVDEAGGLGAELIVAPEMATTGYVWASEDEIRPYCEPARGPTFQALSPVAARHGAWVVAGFPEEADDGLYNSALVIAPDGALAACYRKVLLYSADRPWARPGRRRYVMRTGFGLMAPAICMDMNDDGLILALHRLGVEVLAFCTNWVEEGLDVHAYWRARLAGWRGVLVAADTWGEDRGTRFAGRSVILGPGGKALAELGPEGDGVLVAEVGVLAGGGAAR